MKKTRVETDRCYTDIKTCTPFKTLYLKDYSRAQHWTYAKLFLNIKKYSLL